MVRTLLVRGLVAGAVAGLAFAVFAHLVGEPWVERAIAVEDHMVAAAGTASVDQPVVDRIVQRTAGLLTASLVQGIAVGGLLALVLAVALGRWWPELSARSTIAVLGLIGFVTVVAVPFLVYPANPPGASDDSTIGVRTGLHLAVVAVSLAAAAGAAVLRRRTLSHLGPRAASVGACLVYGVVVALAALVLPPVDEAPPDFPTVVIDGFRLASFGGQLVLWTTLCVVLGALVERPGRRHSAVE